jgi:hypothetical protein
MFELLDIDNDVKYKCSAFQKRVKSLSDKYKGSIVKFPWGKFKGRDAIIDKITVDCNEGIYFTLVALNRRTGEPMLSDSAKDIISLKNFDLSQLKEYQL